MTDIYIPWGEERIEAVHRSQEIENYLTNIDKFNSLEDPKKRAVFWLCQNLNGFKECSHIWPVGK